MDDQQFPQGKWRLYEKLIAGGSALIAATVIVGIIDSALGIFRYLEVFQLVQLGSISIGFGLVIVGGLIWLLTRRAKG